MLDDRCSFPALFKHILGRLAPTSKPHNRIIQNNS